MKNQTYSSEFYRQQRRGSRRSAELVVPILLDLLRPSAVLDVGCGVATWCAEFQAHGVPIVHGVDGPWVDLNELEIPQEDFYPYDFSLKTGSSLGPQNLRKQYDLVTSFEFLEHLEPDAGRRVVEYMCEKSDIIVAGSAIPGQGGDDHRNEQWPKYWSDLFSQFGYEALDAIRPRIWNLEGVLPWYAQNTILYIRGGPSEELLNKTLAILKDELSRPRSIVHPKLFSDFQSATLPFTKRVMRRLRLLD